MIDSLINSLKRQLSKIESQTREGTLQFGNISLLTPINKSIPLLPANIDNSFFLTKPDSGYSLLGLGTLQTFQAKGRQRFQSIKSEYSELLKNWQNSNAVSPIAFLSFAFDENDPMSNSWEQFPNSLLTIPLVVIKENNSAQTLQVNIKLGQTTSHEATLKHIKALLINYIEQAQKYLDKTDPATLDHIDASTPSVHKNTWLAVTQNALTQIQSGHFDKLVTSRQRSLKFNRTISTPGLIQKLVQHYPACTIMSYQSSGKTIISASPERLLTLHHPDIQSNAIGGTILRTRQPDNINSDVQSSSFPLLFKQSPVQMQTESDESKKLLKEHAFISQEIYQCLDPFCHTLKMPISPFLMKLHNLYHLETPIQGKLMKQYDLFDVIETLHPTPAVAGFPAQKARQWLVEHEKYHRGWYTGAFGWIDGNLDGELSVMLRCALIEDNQIDLFAGAGLIAESDPEIEWQETELKMQTILEMLYN